MEKLKKGKNQIISSILTFIIIFIEMFPTLVYAEELNIEELVEVDSIKVTTTTSVQDIERNEKIGLKLEFKIDENPSTYAKAKSNNNWMYDLSDFVGNDAYIKKITDISQASLMEGNQERGTYKVENNKVIFTIDEDWLNSTTYDLEIKFNLELELDPEPIGTADEAEIQLPGAKDAIHVEFKDGNGSATKGIIETPGAGWYNESADKVELEKDENGDFYAYYQDSFKVANVSLNLSQGEELIYNGEISSNQEIDIDSFEINGIPIAREYIIVDSDNNTFSINLTEAYGQDINVNSNVNITYRTKIEEAYIGNEEYNIGVWNWKFGPTTPNEIRFITSEYIVVEPVPVDKSYDKTNNTVTYTVKVGDGETDLAGSTITDVMTDLQKLEGTITITPDVGGETEIISNWDDDEVYSDSDTSLFTYTFPTDAEYTDVYEIKYTTKIIDGSIDIQGEHYIKNAFRYEDANDSEKSNGDETKFIYDFGTLIDVSKDFHSEDIENKVINWRVAINLGKNVALENVKIQEGNPEYQSSDSWMSNKLNIEQNNIKVYELKDEYKNQINDEKTEKEVVEELLKDKKPDEIFQQTNLEYSYNATDKSITIPELDKTVYFVIPTSFTEDVKNSTSTWTFNNDIESYVGATQINTDKATYIYEKEEEEITLMKKEAENIAKGVYKWTVTINEAEKEFIPDLDVYFEDAIPEGMILCDSNGEGVSKYEVSREMKDFSDPTIDWSNPDSCYNITYGYGVPITVEYHGKDKYGKEFWDVIRRITIDSSDETSEINNIARIKLNGNYQREFGEEEGPVGISGVSYVITYYTKLSNEEIEKYESNIIDGSKTYTNTSYLYKEEAEGNPEATAKKEVNFQVDAIEKEALTAEPTEDLIEYSIVANEEEIVLNNNNDIVVKDYIDEKVDLVLNSVSVTDKEGNELTAAKVGYNSNERVLQVKIPDKTYAKITYKLKVKELGVQEITNNAELLGKDSWPASVKKSYRIRAHSGTASGSTTYISIYKVDDADFSKTINNGNFELYSVNNDSKIEEKEINDNKIKFENLAPYELYYLQETKAPTGYELDSNKNYFIVYSIGDNDVETANNKTRAETLKAQLEEEKEIKINVYQNGYEVTVSNKEKTAESAKIRFSGTKELNGRTLEDNEFTFLLKNENGNILQTKTNDSNGKIVFDELEYSEEGTYKYTISELDSEKDGITCDTKVYNVEVEVKKVVDEQTSKLVATIKGLNEDGSGANFVNTYKSTQETEKETDKEESEEEENKPEEKEQTTETETIAEKEDSSVEQKENKEEVVQNNLTSNSNTGDNIGFVVIEMVVSVMLLIGTQIIVSKKKNK